MKFRYKYCYRCGKKYLANSVCCKRVYENKKNDYKRKVYNSHRWRELRKEKSAQTPYCVRCYENYGYLHSDDLQLHHLLSLNDYEQFAYEKGNLIILCRRCNLEIGSTSSIDFTLPKENKMFIDSIMPPC